MIRVLLADDQHLVRAGLRTLLERTEDIIVVGEAETGRAAVRSSLELTPDVVLMDIRMPELDGLAATRQILADERLTKVKIIVLTTFDADDYVFEAIRIGASGFLLKDAEPDELRQAVRVVAAGHALLAPGVTGRVMRAVGSIGEPLSDERLRGLTDREREVLGQVGGGLSNEEIARALYMSPATARTHVSRILSKLAVRDRAALVVLAYETGLVRPGGPT